MRTLLKLILVLFSILVIPISGLAQDSYADIGVDSLFERALTEAADGNYEKARELCNVILDRTPNYHDVRILKGRTFAWEGEYSQARKELSTVLEKSPKYKEALRALFDVEYWSNYPKEALETANLALKYYPTDEASLVNKTKALVELERFTEANTTINMLEDINPSNDQIPTLKRSIGSSRSNNTLTGTYTFETFSQTFDNMHLGYLQWDRRTSLGSIIGRINFSRRFDTSGLQPEIDWYPRIVDGFYGYLNYGYSTSSVFPEHRIGTELYHRLPWSMEGSLGLRHLRFSQSSNVTIYTGSLTKYYGNYYFNIRPYFASHNSGFSRSVMLTMRRYMGSADDYFSLRGSLGISPQTTTYQEVSGDVFRLKSQDIDIELRKNIRYDVNIFGTLGYSHQELLSAPNNYVHIVTFTVGTAIKF